MRSPSHGHEACVCKIGLWTSGGSLRQSVECCRKEDDHRKDDDREKKGDLADRDEALSACQVIGWASDERSEEHTSELQSLMRISYAVFCLKKKTSIKNTRQRTI